MKDLKNNMIKRLRVVVLLILALVVLMACQSEPEEEIKEKEILGGSLTEFDSIDMLGNDVSQNIFEKADVNLIFVWATG